LWLQHPHQHLLKFEAILHLVDSALNTDDFYFAV
jgi:hypothetical protein